MLCYVMLLFAFHTIGVARGFEAMGGGDCMWWEEERQEVGRK